MKTEGVQESSLVELDSTQMCHVKRFNSWDCLNLLSGGHSRAFENHRKLIKKNRVSISEKSEQLLLEDIFPNLYPLLIHAKKIMLITEFKKKV